MCLLKKTHVISNISPLRSELEDPLRALNNYNKVDDGGHGGSGGGGGVYGVVKHMTDEPYSYDEFSYGRLPGGKTTTAATTTTTAPMIPTEEDDRWKIFPRKAQNHGWKGGQESFSSSSSSSSSSSDAEAKDGHMRFTSWPGEKGWKSPTEATPRYSYVLQRTRPDIFQT